MAASRSLLLSRIVSLLKSGMSGNRSNTRSAGTEAIAFVLTLGRDQFDVVIFGNLASDLLQNTATLFSSYGKFSLRNDLPV